MAILTNTLITLRQGLMNYMAKDDWISGTISASAAASAKQMADSVGLLRFQDNYWNTRWAFITSGSNSANSVKVSGFAQSTGVVSLLSAFSAAIAASVSYELLPYNPTTITWALNQALLAIRNKAYRSILNEDLISGNALPNNGGEDWTAASVLNLYANSGVTAAKEANTKLYGRYSMKVTGTASPGNVYISQAEWPALLDLNGISIDFEAWAFTDTVSHARLGIFDDDGTTWSSYHTGGSTWELLKATRTIKAGTKTVGFRFTGDVDTKKAYYDHWRGMNGKVSEYVLPGEFVNADVRKVYIQHDSSAFSANERPCDDSGWVSQPRELNKPRIRYDDRLGVWLMSFEDNLAGGYKIRIEGIEPQNTLSLDTDTIALSTVHLTLLYPYAAYLLLKAFGRHGEAEIHKKKYDELKELNAMPSIPHSAIFKWGRW